MAPRLVLAGLETRRHPRGAFLYALIPTVLLVALPTVTQAAPAPGLTTQHQSCDYATCHLVEVETNSNGAPAVGTQLTTTTDGTACGVATPATAVTDGAGQVLITYEGTTATDEDCTVTTTDPATGYSDITEINAVYYALYAANPAPSWTDPTSAGGPGDPADWWLLAVTACALLAALLGVNLIRTITDRT